MVFSLNMYHVFAAMAAVSLQALGEDMRYHAAGHDVNNQLVTSRRLESYPNRDIENLKSYFNSRIETNLKKLPTQGMVSTLPWPGPRLASYLDSLNFKLNPKEASPAEKYALAFGFNVTDFTNSVSASDGVDSNGQSRKCTKNADCVGTKLATVCALRIGRTAGFCTPKVYDQSASWAKAALLEKEPKCPVVYNGVTFRPNDIKSLLVFAYIDGSTVNVTQAGVRFDDMVDNSTDVYGRPVDPTLRDLNPGYFHIAASNLLGIFDRSFVVDVEANVDVFNYPVRSFKVLEKKDMSLNEAAKTFYRQETYPWNPAATNIVSVKTTLTWVINTDTDGRLASAGQIDRFTAAQNYTYLLEISKKGDIIGGEWVNKSNIVHPDMFWFPEAKPAIDTVTNVGLRYKDASMLLQKSQAC